MPNAKCQTPLQALFCGPALRCANVAPTAHTPVRVKSVRPCTSLARTGRRAPARTSRAPGRLPVRRWCPHSPCAGRPALRPCGHAWPRALVAPQAPLLYGFLCTPTVRAPKAVRRFVRGPGELLGRAHRPLRCRHTTGAHARHGVRSRCVDRAREWPPGRTGGPAHGAVPRRVRVGGRSGRRTATRTGPFRRGRTALYVALRARTVQQLRAQCRARARAATHTHTVAPGCVLPALCLCSALRSHIRDNIRTWRLTAAFWSATFWNTAF